ncbi:Alcohol acetyltransferase [Didymosphaeria variabile]|uniref:Alcohol acetyltransferase n=1 Tax=Didymosphaeria variabile TaxID=1932322 RepID=A0A9W9CBB4_9PLEO|nr:Alcohol acetyltransferase [Didymosphaeria variabile]KAJ4353750.1 Alcohol acetyltransferase [Didymosphaeria variabile]
MGGETGFTNDGESRKVIRTLGYNEQYELAQYTLGFHRGVSTVCRYAVPPNITIVKDVVYRALARVVSDSPMLHTAIKDAESKRPVWVQIAGVDLGQHVEWIEIDSSVQKEAVVQEKIRSELDSKFVELSDRPGWRVVVLQHADDKLLDVVFTWNHAHTDGMGGKIFHDKLLQYLDTETRSDAAIHMNADVKLDFTNTQERFPPATELFVDLSMSPGFLLQQAWNEAKPISLFPNPSAARWAPIRRDSYRTKFRTCIVDNATLSQVLEACRGHKTTLTALTHGLVLLSLASQLDEDAARAFASLTAIDQRRFLPSHPPKYPWLDPNTTMANYVSNTSHEFDGAFVEQIRSCLGGQLPANRLSTDQSNLVWSAASKVREDIHKRLSKGLKDDRLALMKFVTNARALFEKEARKPRALSWAISNLGVMDGTAKGEASPVSEEGVWSIQRAQFTLSAHVPDAALLIAAVSLRGGELVITCTWQDTVVKDALADRLVGDLKRWLSHIGNPVSEV